VIMHKLACIMVFVMLAAPAWCRLGEDLDQLRKRYGEVEEARNVLRGLKWDGKVYKTEYDGLTVFFYVKGGKVAFVWYRKPYMSKEGTLDLVEKIRAGLGDRKNVAVSIPFKGWVEVWDTRVFPDRKAVNALRKIEL